MLKSTAALFAAGLISGLGAAPASAQQYTGTLDEYVTCAAIFFVQADLTTDAELKEAMETGVAISLTRAEPLGARQNLNLDQLIERAVGVTEDIEAAIGRASGAEAQNQVLWNYGPGMSRCIDLVLEE